MRYKAEYSPSELLDPETYTWWPFEPTCRARLDKDPHAIFSQAVSNGNTSGRDREPDPVPADDDHTMDSDSGDEQESEEGDLRRPLPPGFLDPDGLPSALLAEVYVLERGQAMPYLVSSMIVTIHDAC